MNLYVELLKKPVFTAEYVNQYYDNVESTRSALKRLMNQKLIMKIRNNLYTCVSGETGASVANRFQIACMITDSAYISHHTAIEYHGMSDQVFYYVYVSSKTRFHDFEFDGYTYKYIASKTQSGVENVQYSGGIRVTNLEKTLVDSVKDMDKIAGMEEIIGFIESIRKLDEQKVCKYLAEYRNQFLYQKMGYLLETFSTSVGITEEFYTFCQGHIEKSKRYLSNDIYQGTYNAKWKLIVPDMNDYKKNGVEMDD